MADINASVMDFSDEMSRKSPFQIDGVFWGYKVLSGQGAPIALVLGQALSFFFGVCLLTATFGVLVLPTLFFDGGAGVMRVGAAVFMGMTATYLLWFASRGTIPEVHVDITDAQIREVVRHRVGKPTTVGVYAFDEISGVFLEETENPDSLQLVLRYRNTDQSVAMAAGTEAQLSPLRDRVARDLVGISPSNAPEAA